MNWFLILGLCAACFMAGFGWGHFGSASLHDAAKQRLRRRILELEEMLIDREMAEEEIEQISPREQVEILERLLRK